MYGKVTNPEGIGAISRWLSSVTTGNQDMNTERPRQGSE